MGAIRVLLTPVAERPRFIRVSPVGDPCGTLATFDLEAFAKAKAMFRALYNGQQVEVEIRDVGDRQSGR